MEIILPAKMKLEDKVEQLADFYKNSVKSMSAGQKQYAQRLLELITDLIDEQEVRLELLNSKLSGTDNEGYRNNLDRCVDILQCLGFDLVDVQEFNKEETDFIKLHYDSIAKSGKVDKERLLNIRQLFRYYRQTKEVNPTSLKQLIEAYEELR